jgi:hypothetical protein
MFIFVYFEEVVLAIGTPKGDRSKSYGRIEKYELIVNVVELILHKLHNHLILVIIRLDSHSLSIAHRHHSSDAVCIFSIAFQLM